MDPVSVSQFYSKDIYSFEIATSEEAAYNARRNKEPQRMPQRLTGPSQYCKHFRRQAEALENANERSSESDTFCTFVFQKEDGCREFAVCHPEVYWWYTSRKPPEQRCSYEVIPEGSPCWLYFDLEFYKDLNPGSNGPKMTETVIKIFCGYLLKYYQLSCDERNVVNLDSTRGAKFSRHLIFSIKDVAFRDNFHVGRFVKSVCQEIEDYLENSTVVHDVLSQFNRGDLENLFVKTDKKTKIFIDTGVYTRNRHFRMYQSTKWGKLANLVVAPESKYKPFVKHDDRETAIFLGSLISYFPKKKDLVLLEFDENDSVSSKNYLKSPSQAVNWNHNGKSRYPQLDKFILSLVTPGKIRVCKEFEGRKVVYEIIGHRHCYNIDRQHKSNNVYWVADLIKKNVYQKCHDEDCSNFTSTPIAIPQEICFQLADEFDDLLLNLSDSEINP